jgi:hypothetical protein
MMTFLMWLVALSALAFCLLGFGILHLLGSLWQVSEQDDRPWSDDYTRWAEAPEVSAEETVEETSEFIISYELNPLQEIPEKSLP